jgi:hypothetical protein
MQFGNVTIQNKEYGTVAGCVLKFPGLLKQVRRTEQPIDMKLYLKSAENLQYISQEHTQLLFHRYGRKSYLRLHMIVSRNTFFNKFYIGSRQFIKNPV